MNAIVTKMTKKPAKKAKTKKVAPTKATASSTKVKREAAVARGKAGGQKLVAERVAESIRQGKRYSVAAEMRAVGYSKSYSTHPERITGSEVYRLTLKAELAKALPKKKVTSAVSEAVEAQRLEQVPFPAKESVKVIRAVCEKMGYKVICVGEPVLHYRYAYISVADHQHALKAVDLYAKIMGEYAPVKTEQVAPLAGLSEAELDAEIERRRAEIEKPKPSAKPEPPITMDSEDN